MYPNTFLGATVRLLNVDSQEIEEVYIEADGLVNFPEDSVFFPSEAQLVAEFGFAVGNFLDAVEDPFEDEDEDETDPYADLRGDDRSLTSGC